MQIASAVRSAGGGATLRARAASPGIGIALIVSLAAAGAEIERVELEGDAPIRTVEGRIEGDRIVDHRIRANAGQSLAVDLEPSNPSAYFDVLPPDSGTALFVGSIHGNHFEGALPVDGVYTIRVYLMRSAARRGESSRYKLDVELFDGGGPERGTEAPAPRTGFDQTLELQGLRFHLTSANDGSINTLRIVPAGLEIDDSPIERSIDGTVTGAEIADLNADGSPEIYVFVTAAGSGSYGSLVAYAANRRKSLSEIHLPPLAPDSDAAKGYMGHDEFAVVENVLARRFPVYLEGDTNAAPTGGMRQLRYELVQGEAGWLLQLDGVVEF